MDPGISLTLNYYNTKAIVKDEKLEGPMSIGRHSINRIQL
jgi:hypothetical protein